MNYLILLISMGLVTYLLRLSMFVLLRDVEIPEILTRALAFIPSVVLFAFILPDLLAPEGVLLLSPLNSRLLAGLGAATVARRYNNVLYTVVSGFTLLLILNRVF